MQRRPASGLWVRARLIRVVAILGCLGALGVLVGIRSGLRARRLLHPPRSHVTKEDSTKAFAEIPALEEVRLTPSDGVVLRGWYAPGDQHAAVIFVHGVEANRLQLLPEALALHRHGYGFLVFDSRASGESDGDMSTWGDLEQRDVTAALDFVTARPDVAPGRVAVLGFSVGGSAVALTAAHDPRARAVILCATWPSLQGELEQSFKRFGPVSSGAALAVFRASGIDADNVRPINHIGDIAPRPLLLIAGGEDRNTPPTVMQSLFAAAGSPKDMWVVPGAGHGSYWASAPTPFESRVAAFLDGALMEPASSGPASAEGSP